MESYRRALTLANAVMLDPGALYAYGPAVDRGPRWTFGTLAPAAWTGRGGSDPSWLEAQVLVETTPRTRLWGKLRFLQMRERRVETATRHGFQSVSSFEIGGRRLVPRREGDLREIDLPSLEQTQRAIPLACEAACPAETLGEGRARVVEEQWAIHGLVHASFTALRLQQAAGRLTVRVENLTPCEASAGARDEALRMACLSTHLILAVEEGTFVSRADCREWAREPVAACRSTGCHATLTGEPGSRNLVLFSPFILGNHPHVAPETPVDATDGDEIAELLRLR